MFVCVPHPSPHVLPVGIFRFGLSLWNRSFCSWLVEHRKRTWWLKVSVLPQMEMGGRLLLSLCSRNLPLQILLIPNQYLISPLSVGAHYLEVMEEDSVYLLVVLCCVYSREISNPNRFSSRKRCSDIIPNIKYHWWNLLCSPNMSLFNCFKDEMRDKQM